MPKIYASDMDVAHFRFALIAPVIQNTFFESSAAAYFRKVTEKPLTLPDGSTFTYNPKTLEKWTQYYKHKGMDGLMPRTRCDKGSSRALNDTAIEEIFRLKVEFPRLNATQIYFRLVKEGFIPSTVSVASVQRFIKKHDLKSARNPNVKDRKAFEAPYFGSLWQADTCYLPYITEDGQSRRTYLIMIIDDHSRLIVGAKLFYADTAYHFQQVLKQAVAAYGIPHKLYVDNGSVYVNKQLELIGGSIGTLKLQTPVRDGSSKGKIERAFRTLRERWINGLDVESVSSLDHFNDLLADYVRSYNTTVHSSIKDTPINRFIASNAHIKSPKSSGWLDECFHNRVSRKVNNDSCVSIDKVLYDAPQQFIGMKVDIRFLPDRMDEAFILFEDVHYPLKTTDKVANSMTKRNNSFNPLDYSKRGGTAHV
ncbi:DDE-type integrase/transposase/recombinase [Alkaliphilus serpentinus]|uniref:DDE-type integrase/transposase/recombinase n=1 Tax=Alkaliphilus serpentinus TaxID=1482731 RepID=A0A833HL07_9FIRM|nr:DDE-type integrase/transposase/recombinase [Alkaliphilus serpentinus]KAB3524773.1 DDE-type integrase/transposase/recombinase [Alkaliphilus serpentinus]